jgi:hypothetical protein
MLHYLLEIIVMVTVVPGIIVWSAEVVELCCLLVYVVHPDMVFLRIPDTAQNMLISVKIVTVYKTLLYMIYACNCWVTLL